MSESVTEIPVVCSLCGTRVYARYDQIGKKMACPDCDTLNEIKAPPQKAPTRPILDDGDFYKLADEPTPLQDRKPAKETPARVRLTCTVCNLLIHARAADAGKRVRCPDCDALTVIPRLTNSNRERAIDANTAKVINTLDTGAQTRKALAAKMLERARVEIEDTETKKVEDLEAVDVPLTKGMFTFPFQSDVLATWIGMSIASITLFGLVVGIQSAMDTGTHAMIYSAFLVVFSAFVILISLSVFTPKLLAIIEQTSFGQKVVETPPTSEIAGGIMAAIQIATIATISSLLGIAICFLLPDTEPLRWLGFVPTVFVFPICLLSVSESTSLLVPFSSRVVSSLQFAAGKWIAFWMFSTAIVGTVLLVSYLLGNVSPILSLGFLGIAGSLAIVIYCRLVGRLAYLLSESYAQHESRRNDAKDNADDE